MYKKALKFLKKRLKNSELYTFCMSLAEKCSSAAEKISKEGAIDEDLAKILGLIQGLAILKRKKSGRKKRIIYSLIIASLLILAATAAVRVYEEVKDDKDAKNRIKKFFKKINIEKIMKKPLLAEIRRKIKESVE